MLSVTAFQFVMGLVLIIALVVGLIIFLRMKMSGLGNLTDKYKDAPEGNTPYIRKYPEANSFRWSTPFLLLGLICALGTVTLAFAWTTYDKKINIMGDLTLPDDIEIEPPRTAEPPPPPPPPPPPVIEEVPEEEIEEEVIFEDMSVDEETAMEEIIPDPEPEPEPEPEPAPEPEPEPEEEVDEIFTVVEQMPRFPGCEDISGGDAEKKQCAEKKMLEFIYKNIKYPAVARENGVEGTVVIRFVVDKDGSVKAPEIIRDIGGGCGKEALRVVNKMNNLPSKWTPGKQRNNPVKVQFNLPVRFKLEG